MKKHLLLLATLFVGLTACEQEEKSSSISISPNETPVFTDDGGTFEVTVTSSSSWNLSYYCDWCEVSSSYGESGDKVIFTIDPTDITEERESVCIFYCGNESRAEVSLTIKQSAKEYSISLDKTKLNLSATGGEEEIVITSSDEWELSEYPHWCSPSVKKGNSGDKVKLNFDYNSSAENRSEQIIFTCGNKTAEITVSQSIDDSPILEFKDPYFLQAIRWKCDKNGDGKISEAEAACVINLDINGRNLNNKIRNLDEIKYFTELEVLNCSNNDLTSLDVSRNNELNELICWGNKLTSLDLSKNIKLTYLSCGLNSLKSLNISTCTSITTLYCGSHSGDGTTRGRGNYLTHLDVSRCTALTLLDCSGNLLSGLALSENAVLAELDCSYNDLTTLDLNKNTALTELDCSYNDLTTLDLNKNTALTELDCYGNQLTTLNITGLSAIENIDCHENPLLSLDAKGCTSLWNLDCYETNIEILDLRDCKELSYLEVCEEVYQNNNWVYIKNLIIKELIIPKYHTINEDDMRRLNSHYCPNLKITYIE